MVARYEAARSDLVVASRLELARWGIKEPTEDQEAAAFLEAEFKLRVIRFLGGE